MRREPGWQSHPRLVTEAAASAERFNLLLERPWKFRQGKPSGCARRCRAAPGEAAALRSRRLSQTRGDEARGSLI